MEVIETNGGGLKRDLKITIPAQNIADRVSVRLAEIGRTARIHGFRPGKLPAAVLTKRFGAGALGEVAETVIRESMSQAITERKLRPAVEPKIEVTSVVGTGDLEFTVSFEVMPEIALIDFATLVFEREKVDVNDEMVEGALARLATEEKKTRLVEESRPAQKGDTVVIDFLGKVGGVPISGGEGHDYSLELGSNTFIPGFEDQVVGAKVGEKVTFPITFPPEYHADLAGKDAEFEVEVKELREPAIVAVDEELAKTMGMASLEELRKAVREKLDESFKSIARAKLKRKLLDRLSQEQVFPVPESMVAYEFDAIWKEIEASKARNELDSSDRERSEEELRSEYSTIAERRVRLGLLVGDIARNNNITVTKEELTQAIVAQAGRFPGQEKAVFDYYRNTPEAVESLRAPLFEDKVVDFIIERCAISDVLVSADALHREDSAALTENTGATPAVV